MVLETTRQRESYEFEFEMTYQEWFLNIEQILWLPLQKLSRASRDLSLQNKDVHLPTACLYSNIKIN